MPERPQLPRPARSRWAVGTGRRQLDAAADAFEQLYSQRDDETGPG